MIKNVLVVLFMLNCCSIVAQSSINQLDEQGKKNGLWKGYYPESKRIRYEGNFVHGKEVGKFTYYDDTKAADVIATREFEEKEHAAYTIFYNQNKFKVSEGKVVNKLFEGEWKYYHFNSTELMTREFYQNGKLSGVRTVYFVGGKLAEETTYKNGLKEGPSKIYSDKGVVLEESFYKNGQYDGPAIFRTPSGSLASKGNFVLGKKEGIWEFYEKDKLVKRVNMSYPEPSTTAKKN